MLCCKKIISGLPHCSSKNSPGLFTLALSILGIKISSQQFNISNIYCQLLVVTQKHLKDDAYISKHEQMARLTQLASGTAFTRALTAYKTGLSGGVFLAFQKMTLLIFKPTIYPSTLSSPKSIQVALAHYKLLSIDGMSRSDQTIKTHIMQLIKTAFPHFRCRRVRPVLRLKGLRKASHSH